MRTSEEIVLEAARANGWKAKRYTQYQNVNLVYAAWEITRGATKIVAQFDKHDGGMVDAFTSGRDFEGRQDLLDYLKGKP